MAASLQRIRLSFSVLKNLRIHSTSNGTIHRRLKSSKTEEHEQQSFLESTKPSVTLSADESMVICLHPEAKFPYECTKPMPRDTADMSKGDSPLKIQYLQDHKLRHRPDGPTVSELANIFYDTKHQFNPKQRQRRRMRNIPPPDRESI
ncbi:39S ribosomal protein L42, mitochondrial-like [Ostrea edulis]|uniref:39S ribosomal protein L42, mitochondrial-like n=1 Tax=Ostrea edulis TaxID=37623 RepID=UPI0020958D24|nr:39S ribosomal protein L42, mitochondrial-like [Ostrea edulis]